MGAENIILEGGGVIDGNGFFWWTFSGDAGHYVPSMPSKHGPGKVPGGARAPRNIEPFLCKNFLIDNLTIKASPSRVGFGVVGCSPLRRMHVTYTYSLRRMHVTYTYSLRL